MTEPEGPSGSYDPAVGPDGGRNHGPEDSPEDSTAEVPDLGPEEEAAVARLLGGLRETGPVPDDVAARLDRALAELDTERTGSAERAVAAALGAKGREGDQASGAARGAGSAVTSIADRRRRTHAVGSRVAGGLVAAAVVLVIGGGTWALSSRGGGDSSTATSSAADSSSGAGSDSAAGGSAGSREHADAGTGADHSGESDPSGPPSPQARPSQDARTAGGALPVVSSVPGAFRRDASRALAREALGNPAAAGAGSGCPLPAGVPVGADVVPVVLDGRPGLLVARQVGGGRRLVEAYSCTGGAPVASAVVGRRLLR